MGQFKSKLNPLDQLGGEQTANIANLKYDPDEKWSNLYREREKNHLYKWVGVHSGGELLTAFEHDGEDGVLKFALEKIVPMLYEEGQKSQLIRLSDFLKWKKTASTQLGGGKDDAVDPGSDLSSTHFREHNAQWRLNKRGVDGETIIHLLLGRDEPTANEVARILLRYYPGLANDIFLADEMFGQSPLHLAIVHDDYETVQLLLECGADVNARASGQFFVPEDQKGPTPKKITDYMGYAYYGEYPLAFAACFGNKDIYDLLIQNGADPNLQDYFGNFIVFYRFSVLTCKRLGNTILHMCVINYSNSMYSYACRHWAKPADPHVVNTGGYTPLTLASKLGRKEIFDEMLELMKVEFWRFSDMTCSAYPLTTLDTIRPDGSTNYDSALMTVINGNTPEHLDMIGSEVIQRLLADKWKAFASRKLVERLTLLVLHIICICFVVYLRPYQNDRLAMRAPEFQDWVRVVFELLTIGLCLFFVFVQQGDEVRTQGFYGYFRNLKTAPSKMLFLIANICLLACIPFRLFGIFQAEEALFVFALPGSWIFFLFFARSAKLTGPFVQMIYSMIAGDMIRFAIISGIFLVSFSQAFYFVGKDMPNKQKLPIDDDNYCSFQDNEIYTYNNLPETFVSLFRASMGGYEYEEFKCANYEGLTKMLFVLYMIIMPIMMINMLIAMMGNTYTTVIAQAEKAWRQQYAQIVMVLERSVKREKLAACQLEYSIKLSDGGDSGMETRGLMVIKQTKKTRARQRKQAISNWKLIGRKVIKTVQHYGVDVAMYKLHSHERFTSLTDDVVGGARGERLSTSRGWLKSRGGSGRGRPALPPHSAPHDSESIAQREKMVSFDLQEDILKRMDISGPPSVQSEPENRPLRRLRKAPPPPPPAAARAQSFSGLPHTMRRKRSQEPAATIVGVEMEIPNMPGTPSNTPPRVRTDTFRRKDSPVKPSSSRTDSGQTVDGRSQRTISNIDVDV